ncbi:hypothetical protein HQ576_11850, partial [bacterium]|nr:hypothetical protein [bacterium]
MARNPRRRAKFRPFRMTERFQKAVLVALCIFIMVIFAVPTGTCLGRKRGGRDPQATALSIGGRAVTFGEIDEVRSRWTFIYGPALQYMFGGRRESEFLTDAEAIDILTRAHEAERLGVHVSKAQVNDTIRNELFPRRVTVEYLFAKHSDFDGDAKAAEAAVAKARAEIVALFGSPLRGAFERIGSDSSRKLSRGESRPFTARTSLDALAQIADVPAIARRAFADPIGQVSEVVALADRVCLFRVTTRGVGFGPDGLYYPERQSWVGEGYGVAETKPYVDLLREHRVIQAQLEQTVRESIAYDRIYQLYTNSVAGPPGGPYEPADGSALPSATVLDRYRRDNTRAVTAYFSLNAADFARGVSTTDDELRAFYDQHKNTERDEGRVGYLQAEQVTIQYVLGRKRDIEQALSERELRDHYRNNRDEFKDPYEKALPTVRARLAELRLRHLVGETVAQAAERANQGQAPNLPALAAEASRQTAGAFACKTPPPFSARDAEKVVPALREGKLADALFGDNGKQYLLAGEERKPGESRKFISTAFECADGRYFFRVLRREASAEVPYERIAAATREQLVQDITDHKAADAAQEKAREYRTGICQAAFDAFAKAVGAKPIETGYLLADTAIAPIGKTVPKLYDELAVAPVGQMGGLVAEGDHLLLARLIEREDTKGIKLQLIALEKAQAPKDLVPPPALYQQQARYDDDPYQHLDKP